jgi:hypothetical protein
MRKSIALLLVLFIASGALLAQSNVTSVSYNKVSQPALMLDMPYSEDISQDFIIANLKKTGYDPETKGKLFWKQNKLDGFYIFKNVRLEGATESLDLYFKVESKGRKSNASTIYLLLSKQEGSFVPTSPEEPDYAAAKNFLNGFVDQAGAYKLDLDIKDQEDVVKKEEKKLDKLQENEKDMLKKIDDLQKDIRKNKSDQESQQKTIENEKERLNNLKSQVKTGS